jgi:hypothetical protein
VGGRRPDYITDALLIVIGILFGWGAAWVVVVVLLVWWWP